MRWWIISIILFLDTWLPFCSLYLLSSYKVQRVFTCVLSQRIPNDHIIFPQWYFLKNICFHFLVDFFFIPHKSLRFSQNLLENSVKVLFETNNMVCLFFFNTVKKGRLDKTTGKSGSPFNFCFTFFFLRKNHLSLGLLWYVGSTVQYKINV